MHDEKGERKTLKKGGETGSSRIIYIDMLRIILVYLVILMHTDVNHLYYQDPGSSMVTVLLSLLFTIFATGVVDQYFVISGACMAGKEESYRTVFQKRVLRILAVLFFFSLFYYAVACIRGRNDGFSAVDFVRQLLEGTINEPYWFLYAYAAVLLMLPVLRKISGSLEEKDLRYVTAVLAALQGLLPALQCFFGIGINGSLAGGLRLFAMPAWCFICGPWLAGRFHGAEDGGNSTAGEESADRSTEQKRGRNRQLLCCLVGIAAGVIYPAAATFAVHAVTGTWPGEFIGSTELLLAFSCFGFMKLSVEKMRISENAGKKIVYFGSLTFGIYLLEQFCRILTMPVYTFFCRCSTGVIACAVYAGVAFAAAALITAVLKKIRWIGKYI